MITWAEKGIICFIDRVQSTDTYNGYISIPKNHQWFEKNYDEIYSDVHGGITFSGYVRNWDEWVIGFDTFHTGDAPGPNADRNFRDRSMFQGIYRDVGFVKQEIRKLLRQALEVYSKDEILMLEKTQHLRLSKFLLIFN